MVAMPLTVVKAAFLAATLLAGLPWPRSSSTVPRESVAESAVTATAAEPLDRVVLLTANSPDYLALAIPKSYKSAPDAPVHLLVFRGGLCIRDRGIVQAHETGGGSDHSRTVVQETGLTDRATVASDASAAVVASTRYVSQVDLTPGSTSTANDTVSSLTTLTLIDPSHSEGRWQITLEDGRWVNEMLVLPGSAGLVVTTFVPRNGPADLRILDAAGRETVHVPETSGQTLHVEISPRGGYVAVDLAFPESASPWERGVTVFDLAHATQWTYGWRYGSDDEPISWTLDDGGVLALKLGSGTRRFDSTGRRV